ncbi:hypothetical protein GCM10010452_25540 [Crossiella cryophila]
MARGTLGKRLALRSLGQTPRPARRSLSTTVPGSPRLAVTGMVRGAGPGGMPNEAPSWCAALQTCRVP